RRGGPSRYRRARPHPGRPLEQPLHRSHAPRRFAARPQARRRGPDELRHLLTRSRRLVLALVIDLVLVVAEATGGLFAHSSGPVATPGHDLADAAALGIALIAMRLTLKPATATRSFGYHRATILAALANATAIAIVGLGVIALAIFRLVHPAHVHGALMVIFAGAGLVGNAGAALALREPSGDLNFRAVALHFTGDAGAALGVIVA